MDRVPFSQQPPHIQQLFNQRAANYDGCSGEDLYNKVPAHLTDNPREIEAYMADRHVSHKVSEANGGSDDPENLVLERSEGNLKRGSDDMTPAEELKFNVRTLKMHNASKTSTPTMTSINSTSTQKMQSLVALLSAQSLKS